MLGQQLELDPIFIHGILFSVKKVLDDQVAVGEQLQWDIYDAQGVLLLRKGAIPQNIMQIDHLLSSGYYREQQPSNSSAGIVNAESIHANEPLSPDNESQDINNKDIAANQEYDQPFMLQGWKKSEAIRYVIVSIEDAIHKLEPLLQAIIHKEHCSGLDNDIFALADGLQEVVRLSQDTCLASIFFARHSTEQYPLRHSIDTALIAIAIALPLELSRREISRIAAAALTMNAGMLSLQYQLMSKMNPLSDTEKQFIFDHPMISVNLLKAAGITDPLWLDYVLCHHEKQNGSGYPFGMAGNDIPQGAQIICLADRYTAMISPKKYRDGLFPNIVLRQLLFDEGATIDVTHAGILTRIIGIYPPGVFVRLKNREVAVVVGTGRDGATPQVKSILAENNKPLGIPVARDTHDEKYTVVGAVHLQDNEIPFTIKKIWNIEEDWKIPGNR